MKNLDIQVGDRLTFDKNDKEKAIVLVMTNSDQQFYERNFKDDYDNLVKIERIGQNGWYIVYEKKELLTDAEKEFLKVCIKINNDIYYIQSFKKETYLINKENTENLIIIKHNNDIFNQLKESETYTLSELGLEE